jgi:hypothetical protein
VRNSGRWRLWLSIGVALTAAAVLLALPQQRRGRNPSAAQGPATLAQAWPNARPVALPAVLPDGWTYAPMGVVDASTTVGFAGSPGDKQTALVVLTDPAHPRQLQTVAPGGGAYIDAVAATNDQVYWIRSTFDATGQEHAVVWVADLAGGPPRQLAEAGAPALRGSRYELQIVDGRVYWVTTPTTGTPTTEVHSVAINGGTVDTQTVDGTLALTAWPWLTTGVGALGSHTELVNLRTNQTIAVPTLADQQLTCSPTWCRVVTSGPGGGTVVLMRPDGRDKQTIAEAGEGAALADVALLDRFEVLTRPASNNRASTSQRLVLYDLSTRRRILIDAAVGPTLGARGNWLWWSTGDNEALTWHLLDLLTLT